MSRVKMLVLLLAGCLTAVCAIEICAELATPKSDFSIGKVKPEVVLYTICRGPYDKIGPMIGNLYALAGKNGIMPRGSVYYVYLNNPGQVSSEHWLTEIRIPVSKESLEKAGTLGKMTDIKQMPAMEMAVAIKPEGQTDPSGIYNNLYAWILKQGYVPLSAHREIFLTNAMSGDYGRMKTKIMISVQKLSVDKN